MYDNSQGTSYLHACERWYFCSDVIKIYFFNTKIKLKTLPSRDKTKRDGAIRYETRRDETRRDETRWDETRRNETRRNKTSVFSKTRPKHIISRQDQDKIQVFQDKTQDKTWW